MRTADVLRKAKRRIKDKNKWCEGSLFEGKDGTYAKDIMDKSATKFCAIGSLLRTVKNNQSLQQYKCAVKLLNQVAKEKFAETCIENVNDELGHRAVMLAYTAAIKKAERL